MSAKKRGLGRGLDALLSSSKPAPSADNQQQNAVTTEPVSDAVAEQNKGELQKLAIEFLQSGKYQPRKDMSEEALEELASSIRAQGIIQPIVVRPIGANKYEIIAGERRWRAAQLAKLDSVPCIIKDVPDEAAVAIALIENIQREDLNPLEEAEAYQRLSQDHQLSQDQIAKQLGKSRVVITNTLRLLRLPMDVRAYIAEGLLTAGHARALLSLMTPEHQRQLAKRIVEENLSVRQVEALVGRSSAHKRKAKKARNLNSEIVDLEHQLTTHLGSRVRVIPKKNMKQGRLEIQYLSLDDLDRILEKMQLPKS